MQSRNLHLAILAKLYTSTSIMIMSILLQLCIRSARLLPLNWTYILHSGPFLGEYILSFRALHGRGNPLQLLDSTNSPSRNPGYGPEQCLYNTITNFAHGRHVGMSWDKASFMTHTLLHFP